MTEQIILHISGETIFTTKLPTKFDNATESKRLGEAVKLAVKQEANLRGVSLIGAYLTGANLTWADLTDADLEEVNLTGADLEGANLLRVNLRGANLEGADLTDADLEGANLTEVNLTGANLEGANLLRVNLRGVDLEGVDLEGANLEPIKLDMFKILKKTIPEIPMLEKAILEGKIDGSTYEGECACLVGTIEKSGRFGEKCDMRDEDRPIERFFMGIDKGDTPENNQVSKIVLGWIHEFKTLEGIE